MKVLITGCNKTRKSVVETLKNNRDGRDIYVIGINSREDNILRSVVDKFIVAPPISSPEYVGWLEDVCRREEIDIIFPFLDIELPLAAKYRERLEGHGTKVSITSAESLALLDDKIAMAQRYSQYMPRQKVVRNSTDVRAFAHSIGYSSRRDGTVGDQISMCCKLAGHSGGYGFAVVDERKWMDLCLFNKGRRHLSLEQLCTVVDHAWLNKIPHDIILQEFVEGIGYAVTVFADHGKVIGMCGYTGGGISDGSFTSGEVKKVDAAYDICRTISEESGLDGNACYDFILRPDGTPVLLECNPRLHATIAFVEKAGGDFVYQRCRQLLGEDYVKEYDINYGLKMMKYPDYIFF